jgi:hypothetical protein
VSVRSARYNLLSLRNPKGLTVIPEERDAWAFLDAAKITSSRQQRAVIELVRGLKHAQLWSKMKAIYPFVGGTATTHKFNLKDPRDNNAAFRLNFSGGWTHSSNGADPNGTNSYADTYCTPSIDLVLNSTHIMYYSRENSNATEVEFGSRNAANTNYLIIEIRTSGVTYGRAYDNAYMTFNDADSIGCYVLNRTSSTALSILKNNVSKATTTRTASARPDTSLFLGAFSEGGAAAFYSTKQCAFATIGDGLTDTDATNLYNIIQRYQIALGRSV